MLFGHYVHARAGGEIFRRLGAAVHHDDQWNGLSMIPARHVELVGPAAGLIGEGAVEEFFAAAGFAERQKSFSEELAWCRRRWRHVYFSAGIGSRRRVWCVRGLRGPRPRAQLVLQHRCRLGQLPGLGEPHDFQHVTGKRKIHVFGAFLIMPCQAVKF